MCEAILVRLCLQFILDAALRIGPDGARVIAEAIKVNSTLQQLNLHGASLSLSLVVFLLSVPSILSIDLFSSIDTETEIGLDGTRAIAAALTVNSSLEQLDIGSASLHLQLP